MRILLASHAAWRHTGYGTPVLPWARQMVTHGHQVAVLAIEERGPGLMEYKGLPHYLPMGSPYGDDVVKVIADDWEADVVVSIFEPWVLNPQGYSVSGRKWIAWCPVDQTPPQRGMLERLACARISAPFSQWGADVLKTAEPSLPVRAMPIGIDTETFKPNSIARKRVRAAMELPEDAFLVGMVGTNLPGDRKALAQNVAGFCQFATTNPNAYLILRTTQVGGIRLEPYLKQLGKAADRVLGMNQWEMAYGGSTQGLADFYNSLDVLLHASAAEGFGLPILEAMACGVPVIGANNTSMTELIPDRCGWLVNEFTPEWTRLDGWWKRPTSEGVAEALRMARSEIASVGIERPYADDCRGWAKSFDWEIVGEQWAELLKEI